MDTTGTPSRWWWGRVADQHTEMLAEYGFGEVKRHQALRYFTWQWRWRQILRSEQLRFLLRETRKTDLVRVVLTRQSLSAGLWRGLAWNRADRWLYAVATRLVWLYAQAHGDPVVLGLCEPALGNPPPVTWRGSIVSQDLANCSLEVEAIRRSLDGAVPTSILEIGSGDGRSAYSLMGVFPDASYTVVDLEPALSITRFYLTSLYPDRDLHFVDAGKIDTLECVPDLVVAIASLEDTTPDQAATYLELLGTIAPSGGTVFVKQWGEWQNPDDGVEVRLDEYPIPSGWTRVLHEPSPVQTRFLQVAWRT